MPRTGPTTVLVLTDGGRTPNFVAELTTVGTSRPVAGALALDAGVEAVRVHRPDVVVAEVSNLDRIPQLAAVAREVAGRVVMVSGLVDGMALVPALVAGARGFVRKPLGNRLLHNAIDAVAAGNVFVDPRSTSLLVELAVRGQMARADHGLTLRQAQVVQLLRGGMTNREIATALGLSLETVKTHVRQTLRKLGARDRREAAAYAERPLAPNEVVPP